MNVSIFGLGYVGVVCSACLAKSGHSVIGVDVNKSKVEMVNCGVSPIIEPELDTYLLQAVKEKRLVATDQSRDAVLNTDISMICVGTPSLRNGSLNLNYVRQVAEEIGLALADKNTSHTVIVRSTVLPGTTQNLVIPALEKASGKKAGVDFFVAMNPEFLREGTAIRDFYAPPMTVIGQVHEQAGDALCNLYQNLPGKCIRTGVEVAEMTKYACNAWHAAKVCFGNEIGVLAKSLGVDGRQVMDLVCRDSKLNISPAYLKPGFAFGGSCLPKDVKALTYHAQNEDITAPFLNSIMPSNEEHIQHGFRLITQHGKRRVGMLGLSFKADTDDLRESPLLSIAERLVGKGYELKIYDKNVKEAHGKSEANDYLTREIGHVSQLISDDMNDVIQTSDVLVVGNHSQEFRDILTNLCPNKKVVDLAGLLSQQTDGQYEGVCW